MTLPKATDGERHRVRAVLPLLAVLVSYVGVGAACGWLWYRLWAPPATGVVVTVEGEPLWVPQPFIEGYATEFSGTGWYVVIACAAGILLGLLTGALIYRGELVVLATVIVGSAIAAWLMYETGIWLSPEDPQRLAETAEPGATLDAALVVHGRSPFLAFPVGSCLGLSVGLLGFTRRPSEYDEPGLHGRLPG